MSEPKPLNPTEQDALVKQIGLTLMRAAPEDWRHVTAEYRATGRYFELAAEVRLADGTMRAWTPPQDVTGLFARLRAGMYREGRGSWSNARYQLDHPSSYNLDFDRAEPDWQTPPPPQAYVDEMRFFPRTDENVPDWLRRRLDRSAPPQSAPLSAAPPVAPPRGFRTARVFDGAGPGGRPSVNRPPVAEGDHELLLAYLDRAPVAVVGRGFDADVLNPDAPAVVPVAFQTDGHWIWPAAVGYYLRSYGVPPEPELVERAKANDYLLPEVSEDARVAAAANLGAPAAPRDTPLPAAEPPVSEPTSQLPAPQLPSSEYEERFDAAEQPVEVGATVAAPLPVLLGDDEPEAVADAPSDVEETANLTEIKPDSVEYAQEGPPYRVRFEEDGPVIDDRYRRESYVDGMDLFAPVTTYDRDPTDTQAWSPFADEEPPASVEETAEVAVVTDEPVEAEEQPADDLADEPVAEEPVAEELPVGEAVADEPAENEQTTEIEVAQDELFHEQQAYEDQPRFEDRPQFEDPPQFQDSPQFEDRAQFEDQQPFEDRPTFEERPQFEGQPQFEEQQPFEGQSQFEGGRFEDQRFAEESYQEPEPRQVTQDEERELSGARRALDELDVPPTAYRFGEPVDRTWLLRTEGQDWEVSWFDHGPTNPVRFDRVEDATAYLVGKLILTGRRTPRPLPPPPPRNQPPRPPAGEGFREDPPRPPLNEGFRDEQPHRPLNEGFREEPPRPPANDGFRDEPQRAHGEGFREDPQRPPLNNGFRDDRRPVPPPPPRPAETRPVDVRPVEARPTETRAAESQPDSPKSRSWPITPMNGEPPLTLFRHKKMIELPAGMEVDRFGDGGGNLVYAAGTPFAERSLVPSWINRPYRVYRLRRTVEVLTGVAVPWFEQPGGGTAYLMPKSVEEMLADGVLVEVANQEAPTQ